MTGRGETDDAPMDSVPLSALEPDIPSDQPIPGTPDGGAHRRATTDVRATLDLVRRTFRPTGRAPSEGRVGRASDARNAEPARGPLPKGASSVLATLVDAPGGPYVLLERRPAGPSPFAGQLSFPGGRIEPSDATPLAAALREAEEEVGFPVSAVEVVGHLTDLDNHLGRLVCAYVGILPLVAVPAQAASPGEVEELLLVPLHGLRVPGAAPSAGLAQAEAEVTRAQPGVGAAGRDGPHDGGVTWTSSDGGGTLPDAGAPTLAYRVTAYESRSFSARERPLHYWHLAALHAPPPGQPSTAVLWGLTGELVARLLARVYGWAPPAAPSPVASWEDLRP